MVFIAIYALVVLMLPLAVWRYPSVSVAALICVQVIDFWGQMSSQFIASNGTVTNIYIVAVLALGALRTLVKNGGFKPALSVSTLLLISLWAFALISVMWTPVPDIALAQWGLYWPYMLMAVFVIPLIVNNHDDAAVALKALIVLGGLLALAVDVFVEWENRYVVAFWDPNTKFWNALAFAQMAGYTAIAAALVNMKTSAVTVIWRLFVISACMVLAVKSGSRGQFILMVGLSLLLLPISRQSRNWRAYISIVALISCVSLASYFAFDYFSGTDERWSSERFDADLEGRMSMARGLTIYWWEAASSSAISLFFGLGNSSSFSEQIVGFYPHMVPIEVLAEEGLIGFTLFLALNVLFVKLAMNSLAETAGNKEHRGVAAALIGMYIFAALLSLKQGSLLNMSPEIFLFLIIIERLVRNRVRSRITIAESGDVKKGTIPTRKYPNLCP